MNAVLAEVLQSELRNVLQIVVGYIGITIILCTLLHRRKHIWILVSFLLVKSLYSQVITGLLVYMHGDIAEFLPVFNAIVLPILDMVLVCSFFRDPVYKAIPAMMIAEVPGIMVLMFCFLVVNVIEGRSDPLTFVGTFMWTDLLLIPLYLIAFGILYKVIKPLLLKYREREIKHPLILLTLVGLYTLSAYGSYVTNYGNTQQVKYYYYINISWMLFFVLLGSIFLRQLRTDTKLRAQQIRLQQELMSAHYTAVRQQDMEESSRIVEAQMQEILSSDISQIRSDKIEAYLQHLREHRDRMQAGIYCSDWLIDAVLYCQKERMIRQGKKLSLEVNSFDRGTIDERELAQLLFELLADAASQSDSGLHLIMTTVRGQLLITLKMQPGGKRRRKTALPRSVKEIMKKYDGYVSENQQTDKREITISLTAK